MRRHLRIAAAIGLLVALASPLAAKSVDEYLDEMREGYPASIGKALKGDTATAREILRRCAAKSEWRRRSACMFLASDLADPMLGDAIRPFLDDENRHVREQAVGVYSESAGVIAIDELERITLSDSGSGVRVQAMIQLSKHAAGASPDLKARLHRLYRRNLESKRPLVKLIAGILLVQDGEMVPRLVAIDNMEAPSEESREPGHLAIKLLGYVGNEEDLRRMEATLAAEARLTPRERIERRKAGKKAPPVQEMREAVSTLRLALANSDTEREDSLRNALRAEPNVGYREALRRHFLGEKWVLGVLESVARDSSDSGSQAAASALKAIREREATLK